MNKIILIGLFLFTLLSCGEHKEDTYIFTTQEKWIIKNKYGKECYVVKCKDTTFYNISPIYFKKYSRGDTIILSKITSGFYNGCYYIN